MYRHSARPGREIACERSGETMRAHKIAGLILAAAALRLLPHPPNFTPIGAIALFGAATMPRQWLAFAVPFVALLLSDAGLELLHRVGLSSAAGFHARWWVVYASFAAVTGIGFLLRLRIAPATIVFASLAGSLVFFALTNLACWWASDIYSQDVRGLISCYTAGIPFLWPALAGDLIYTTALFGTLARGDARSAHLRLVDSGPDGVVETAVVR